MAFIALLFIAGAASSAAAFMAFRFMAFIALMAFIAFMAAMIAGDVGARAELRAWDYLLSQKSMGNSHVHRPHLLSNSTSSE